MTGASATDLVPITVIAGYLGAGKTTLINQLLTADHGRRLAVIVNDFGDVNIDADLITAHGGETVRLQNGCVCCSIADALGDALDAVLELDPRPEQILIEASGVADPKNVASYGRGWPGCQLDAVVVLADAATIRARSHDQFVGELVTRQLRRADIVVMTKCDLVSESARGATLGWLRDAVGGAPVVFHSGGRIDPALLLRPGAPTEADLGDSRSTDQEHGSATSLPQFESMTLDVDGPLDRARVETALGTWPDTVVRVKGLIRLTPETDRLHLVQRVGRRWTIEEAPPAVDPSAAGRLVVLGLPATLRRRELMAALV